MKLTYTMEGNCICLSNKAKEKHLEWIHAGILRVYEKKNSEELVRLNYRNESVESEITIEGDSLLIRTGDYEIRVDEELTLYITRNGQPYFEEYAGEDAKVYEEDKDFDLAKLEGHKEEATLADFSAQMVFRLFDDEDKIYGLGDKAAHLNR